MNRLNKVKVGVHFQIMNLFFPFSYLEFCNLLARSRSCRSCLIHPIFSTLELVSAYFIRNKPIGKGQSNIKSGSVGFLHPTTNHSAYLIGLAVEFYAGYGPSSLTRSSSTLNSTKFWVQIYAVIIHINRLI
jgi:hypothetical protein